ncbi:MAG: MotA/TolQ/ExbB proton channel family protein [Bacteriovoracaceae bacterium]|nr:MotA/TolQ/ExbB proton channel family protein [Bacteriovoracaceae bacterium]
MEVASDLNILKILWESGVVVKLVLLILIIASIMSWAIVFKKKNLIKKIRKNNNDFFNIYSSSQNLKEVMDKSHLLPFSPYKAMFVEGYTELSKIKDTFTGSPNPSGGVQDHFRNFGLGVLERGLKKGVNQSNEQLDALLSTLASIGSISPFIGLFGTVWGIIGSFTGLAGGGGTIEAVAPGIAEALVATAVGLAAAIPAVWFFNYFNNQNQVIHGEMESFGQDFLNTIERTLVHK